MSLESNSMNLEKLNKEIIPFFTSNLDYFRQKYSQKLAYCQDSNIIANTESLEKLANELAEFNKLAQVLKDFLLRKMQETSEKIQETTKEKFTAEGILKSILEEKNISKERWLMAKENFESSKREQIDIGASVKYLCVRKKELRAQISQVIREKSVETAMIERKIMENYEEKSRLKHCNKINRSIILQTDIEKYKTEKKLNESKAELCEKIEKYRKLNEELKNLEFRFDDIELHINYFQNAIKKKNEEKLKIKENIEIFSRKLGDLAVKIGINNDTKILLEKNTDLLGLQEKNDKILEIEKEIVDIQQQNNKKIYKAIARTYAVNIFVEYLPIVLNLKKKKKVIKGEVKSAFSTKIKKIEEESKRKIEILERKNEKNQETLEEHRPKKNKSKSRRKKNTEKSQEPDKNAIPTSILKQPESSSKTKEISDFFNTYFH